MSFKAIRLRFHSVATRFSVLSGTRFNRVTYYRFIPFGILQKFAAKLRAISIPGPPPARRMPVDYFTPTEFSRYHRAWYARPWFYLPLALVVVVLVAGLLAFIPTAVSLRQQAAALDLSHLEKMESASVILDRNNKIFGQIYVENRETVPYDQLPPNLVNAIIATEDNKFYQHHGYDLLGNHPGRAQECRRRPCSAGREHDHPAIGAEQLRSQGQNLSPQAARDVRRPSNRGAISPSKKSWSCISTGFISAEASTARRRLRAVTSTNRRARCPLRNAPPSPDWSRALTSCLPGPIAAASSEARNFVLNRMRELGFINAEQLSSAQAEELVIGNRQNARGQNYAIDYIRQQVIAAVGWDRAMSDGFRIHTTIDSGMQDVAEKSLRAQLDAAEENPRLQPSNLRPIQRPAPGAPEQIA